MPRVFLGLGANLGDRLATLQRAVDLLGAVEGIRPVASSRLYETEPVGYLDQPWFLNCVVEGETNRQPQELLESFRAMEMAFHSRKEFVNGPRILDIDILLFGDQSFDTPDLKIPHPRMLDRKFVLVPLAEIAPDQKHPAWAANVSELLAKSKDTSEVRRVP